MKRAAWLVILMAIAASPIGVRAGDGNGNGANVVDGNQPIAAYPFTSDAEIALSDFGKPAVANGVTTLPEVYLDNKVVRNFRGAGILTPNDGRVVNCTSTHNYIGCKLGSSDSLIAHSTLSNNRDACLWFARDCGNCQSDFTHCYGARIACYIEPGGWHRLRGDVYADSFFGCVVSGWNITFSNVLCQHNTVRDFVIDGYANTVIGSTIIVQREVIDAERKVLIPGFPSYAGKAGAEINGTANKLIDCNIQLANWQHPLNHASGNPAIAAVILNCDKTKVTGRIDDADGVSGSTGVLFVGQHTGAVIDLDVSGFDEAGDKVIAYKDGATINGLDSTLRVDGKRPITDYIDVSADWHGTQRVVDVRRNIKYTVTK